MKKIAPMVVLLVVVTALTTTYAIFQTQQAPIWQIKLGNYIKYRNDTLVKDPRRSGMVTIVTVKAASHPENFHQIGDKRLVTWDHYWLLENEDVLTSAPVQVICVLLEEGIPTDGDPASKLSYQLLFLAHFSQQVEPNWLIYQGNNAAVVGCDLALPGKPSSPDAGLASDWQSKDAAEIAGLVEQGIRCKLSAEDL